MENVVKRILERISEEAAYRQALYKLLKLCQTPKSLSEIEAQARQFPEMAAAVHEPVLLLSWLEEVRAIRRIEEKDNEYWVTTESGCEAATTEAPETKLQRLLSQSPGHKPIYRQVLEYCQAPKSRHEIGSLLDINPLLETEHLLPAYFIQQLEKVGALEWIDKAWQTTPVGHNPIRQIS